MDQEKIDRINALARKARSAEGLTPQEAEEQTLLRREYIAAFRNNLEGQLKRIHIVEPDGTRHPLRKKEE